MKLTFYGGAQSVTGANYLLESEGTKILVDCGLFQGSSFFEANNFKPFPYDPKEIDAIFVTHAHIDHIGRVPQLVKRGFKGRIFSSEPSRDFAEPLLLDAEHMARHETAERLQSEIYTEKDIMEALKRWEGIPYHQKVEVGPFTVELYDAGHVLGSSSPVVTVEGERIVFSGDLGNVPAPFIHPTEYVPDADYALIESVYGNRVHENVDLRKETVEDLIEDTVKKGGTLMIPAFALERTQEMLFELNDLAERGRIPHVPIFIDSPLAIRLTAVYQLYERNPLYFNPEAVALSKQGDTLFNFPGLRMTLTTEQSKEINEIQGPKIIIAGSGMSNGGRIIHHERRYLPDPKSTLLIVGYQEKGSLGRKILDGEKSVRIMNEDVPVRCRVKAIGGYSAHADQPQLLAWVSAMRGSVKKVFVVQGEEESANALSQKIKDTLAVDAEVPHAGATVVI